MTPEQFLEKCEATVTALWERDQYMDLCLAALATRDEAGDPFPGGPSPVWAFLEDLDPPGTLDVWAMTRVGHDGDLKTQLRKRIKRFASDCGAKVVAVIGQERMSQEETCDRAVIFTEGPGFTRAIRAASTTENDEGVLGPWVTLDQVAAESFPFTKLLPQYDAN